MWAWNETDELWSTSYYDFWQKTYCNIGPSFSSESPSNQSTDVDLTTSSLSLAISDLEGDTFNYSIETYPDIGNSSGFGVSNGTKTCSVSNLEYDTNYIWYVNTTDTYNSTNATYYFVTESEPNNSPVCSSPVPSNESTGVSISTSSVNVTIADPDGDTFNWTIETFPDIGNSSANSASNGSKTCSISGLSYSTTYKCFVNVTDGTNTIHRFYTFSTQSAPGGGDGGSSGGGTSGGGSSGGGIIYVPPSNETQDNNAPETPLTLQGLSYIELGVQYSYETSTYDIDSDQIRYKFDWGDENISDWSSFYYSNDTVSMSHIWYQLENYSIKVIAQDENGLNSSWSDSLVIYVSEAQSNVIYVDENNSIPINATLDQNISFNASGLFENESDIVSYYWEFGDGTIGYGKNLFHIYTSAGRYNVTVIATDNNGIAYSKTFTVTVSTESGSDQHEKKTNFAFPIEYIIILIVIVIVLWFLIKYRNKILIFIYKKQVSKYDRKDSNKVSETKEKSNEDLISDIRNQIDKWDI